MKEINLFPSFCDYISHRIKKALDEKDPEGIVVGTGAIRFDLDGNGSYVSTTKRFTVTDSNGRVYQITVEDKND